MITKKTLAAVALTIPFLSVPSAQAQQMDGITQLACEAVLCLSSPTRPGECAASISHYFGIVMSKPWKTVQARKNFLKLCPDVKEADIKQTTAAANILQQTADTSTSALAASTKSDLETRLAALRPAWDAQTALSTSARTKLEQCVQSTGRIEDGVCATEKADFDAQRLPAIAMRDEIERIEAQLVNLGD
jgi:prephenate dehydratase